MIYAVILDFGAQVLIWLSQQHQHPPPLPWMQKKNNLYLI